ncbi:MAG: hypothetical protein ACOYMA_20340 [Bacteroidia bacterium]
MKTNKTIQKLKQLPALLFTSINGFILGYALVAIMLFFTSCEKAPQQAQQSKMLHVKVQTEGLIVKPLNKSWNINDWTFVYNPNSYVLKFEGVNNTYEFSKTIQQLQQGFEVQIMPDNYTITYTSIHNGMGANNELSDNLDIQINESQAITNNDPITLVGHHNDYLVIMDVNYLQSAMIKNPFTNLWAYELYSSPDPSKNYKYMYGENVGNLDLKYVVNDPITGTQTKYNTIQNTEKNNIYHIVSSVNGGTSINILPFSYNMIGW